MSPKTTRGRQLRNALTREREFSSRLIESSQECISAFDPACRYTLWNRSMESLTGLPRQAAVGRPVVEVLPFLAETGEDACFHAALEGRSVASRDRPYWIPSTNRRGFYEANYSPIRADTGRAQGEGRIVGGLAVMRDITERRQSEESLRSLSARILQIQDQERRRIARDLHDGTSQMLMGIKLDLDSLQRMELPSNAVSLVAEARQLAERAAQEVRATSYLLHPPELDLIGLPGAARSFIRGFSERTGIQIDMEIAADLGRLPDDVEIALFRILQEALANVHRHSHSTHARVTLKRERDNVVEVIQDFGQGMPAGKFPGESDALPGVGIAGMRARVRQLGGEAQIASNPQGTAVTVKVPAIERDPNGISCREE